MRQTIPEIIVSSLFNDEENELSKLSRFMVVEAVFAACCLLLMGTCLIWMLISSSQGKYLIFNIRLTPSFYLITQLNHENYISFQQHFPFYIFILLCISLCLLFVGIPNYFLSHIKKQIQLPYISSIMKAIYIITSAIFCTGLLMLFSSNIIFDIINPPINIFETPIANLTLLGITKTILCFAIAAPVVIGCFGLVIISIPNQWGTEENSTPFPNPMNFLWLNIGTRTLLIVLLYNFIYASNVT